MWPKGIPSGAQNAVQSSLFPGGYPGLYTASLTTQNDYPIGVGVLLSPHRPNIFSPCLLQFPSVTDQNEFVHPALGGANTKH